MGTLNGNGRGDGWCMFSGIWNQMGDGVGQGDRTGNGESRTVWDPERREDTPIVSPYYGDGSVDFD